MMITDVLLPCPRGPRGQLVLDQGAAFHDGGDARLVLQQTDVGERVAIDDEQVGQVTLSHRAQLVARVRGARRR